MRAASHRGGLFVVMPYRKPMPSAEELRQLIHYNPDTGVLTSKVTRKGLVKGQIMGCDSPHRYLLIRFKGPQYIAHRLIYRIVTGIDLGQQEIDHINGNTKDNRWSNLRVVERLENTWNTRKSKNNTSGVKGIDWVKNRSRWRARVAYNNKTFTLGLFSSIDDAVEAIAALREKLHAEFANHGTGSILLEA